jgi:hypothetical protein
MLVALIVATFASSSIICPYYFMLGCIKGHPRCKSKYHVCYLEKTPISRSCRCNVCDWKTEEVKRLGLIVPFDMVVNPCIYTCQKCDFDICSECYNDDAPEKEEEEEEEEHPAQDIEEGGERKANLASEVWVQGLPNKVSVTMHGSSIYNLIFEV